MNNFGFEKLNDHIYYLWLDKGPKMTLIPDGPHVISSYYVPSLWTRLCEILITWVIAFDCFRLTDLFSILTYISVTLISIFITRYLMKYYCDCVLRFSPHIWRIPFHWESFYSRLKLRKIMCRVIDRARHSHSSLFEVSD